MQASALLRAPRSGFRLVVTSFRRFGSAPVVSLSTRAENFAIINSQAKGPTSRPFVWSSRSFFSGHMAQSNSTACDASFANASCHEAHDLASSGSHVYLDVRTPEEFAASHPKGAINIPLLLKAGDGMAPNPEFLTQVQSAFPKKDSAVCLGCAAGKRSEMAAAKLAEVGYTNLVNVNGGFQAWAAAGLPTGKYV